MMTIEARRAVPLSATKESQPALSPEDPRTVSFRFPSRIGLPSEQMAEFNDAGTCEWQGLVLDGALLVSEHLGRCDPGGIPGGVNGRQEAHQDSRAGDPDSIDSPRLERDVA